jgi:hypothetical protein
MPSTRQSAPAPYTSVGSVSPWFRLAVLSVWGELGRVPSDWTPKSWQRGRGTTLTGKRAPSLVEEMRRPPGAVPRSSAEP